MDSGRAFRLRVAPAVDEAYGLVLDETHGANGHTLANAVVVTTAAQTARVIDAVVAAVRNAGHQPSVLAFSRTEPIPLDEPSGVRLALILISA